MERVGREELGSQRHSVDRAARESLDIDTFCSSSAWVLSADAALMGAREPFCYRSERGWMLLARRRGEGTASWLEGLEAAWCLACPLLVVAGMERAFVEEARDVWRRSAPGEPLLLSGLKAGSILYEELVRALSPHYVLRPGAFPPARRVRASLVGGVGGFLSRRSGKLRKRLRQAQRRAVAAGVSFEPVVARESAQALAVLERLLAIEARSWKGLAGDGLAVPEMQAFYQKMVPMLAEDGRLRAIVSRRGGEDVGMLVGALIDTRDGGLFRGLQFSFDERLRHLSLGNLLQVAQVRALEDEGPVLYDLGAEVEYKWRWGEEALETVTLLAVPRHADDDGTLRPG